MKKLIYAFSIVVLLSLGIISIVFAQSEQLTLKLSRDWGYGGLNGDIEGLFSMRVSGPADLVRVEYYIDDTKIGEVEKSPYSLQFTTDNYSLGVHKLSAVGFSKSGQKYPSNILTVNFVPRQSIGKTLLPILAVVLVALLLSAFGPLLFRRGKHLSLPLGAERKYGVAGGGICPNCHRPFALPIISAHIGFSKLAACPFCGKLSLVRVESLNKLREAEKAELEWRNPEVGLGEAKKEDLGKEIDESKYQDLE